MGSVALIFLLPVYIVAGCAIGARQGRNEAMDDWHRDWKSIRLSTTGDSDA